jgi:hypothetical protein
MVQVFGVLRCRATPHMGSWHARCPATSLNETCELLCWGQKECWTLHQQDTFYSPTFANPAH